MDNNQNIIKQTEITNLIKQIQIIDLTLDEPPAKKQRCATEKKENCPLELNLGLNDSNIQIPEPTLFVELPNREIQVPDSENNKIQPPISSSEDNISVFTCGAPNIEVPEPALFVEVVNEQIEVIDLTVDESPTKKQACDIDNKKKFALKLNLEVNVPNKQLNVEHQVPNAEINLAKQIDIIDLTLDESPAKKQVCDTENKENCALKLNLEVNHSDIEVPKPELFVENVTEQNNQLPNVEIPENSETQPPISSSEDNTPVFTFRGSSSSSASSHELENEITGKHKIITMKNFDILNNTTLISKSPLLYRFQDQEFNLVRIVGTIRRIEPTTKSKTILTIDDGSCIKVIFDSSKEKHAVRDKVLELMNRTSKCEKIAKKDLIKYANMDELQYVNETPQETRNMLMDTFTNILIKKLYAKLEIQFPKTFEGGEQVEIVGRLLPRKPESFIYSEEPYIIYVHYLKRLMSENEYMWKEHEIRNNIEEDIVDKPEEQVCRYVDILDDEDDNNN